MQRTKIELIEGMGDAVAKMRVEPDLKAAHHLKLLTMTRNVFFHFKCWAYIPLYRRAFSPSSFKPENSTYFGYGVAHTFLYIYGSKYYKTWHINVFII
jgi:hypothetical protein